MTRPLWPHQIKAIYLLRDRIAARKRRLMLQIATGGGKTRMAAEIIRMAREKGNRVVFVVPAIDLIDQTVEAFAREGICDVGVIQADHPMTDYSQPVQIASVQTLARRKLPDTDMVIVDEAHRTFRIIFEWMKAEPDMVFIGLSATPWAKGLGKHYDELIIAATTKELIAEGVLSDFRVYAPSHPDLTGVRTVAGDYHEGDLSEAMDKPQLTADVVSTWLKLGENLPTLCFGVDRAHAKSLCKQFQLAGVSAVYVDAYTSREERNAYKEAFQAGRVKVIVNVGVMTTGVDLDVRCLILARPTKSEMLYVQIIGRALRRAEGKDAAIILDHSDTTLNLGFVTDIHHPDLDNGRERKSSGATRERKAPQPKECTACTYLKPAGVHKCPACGFAPEKQPTIECADGSLTQVSGKKVKYDRETKQKWYSMLRYHAEERGMKPGWVAHKFKEKFGVWPRGLAEFSTAPDVEVGNYIRASMIRFAKGQKKRATQGGQHAPA
jgi:DNA repair protein RadD